MHQIPFRREGYVSPTSWQLKSTALTFIGVGIMLTAAGLYNAVPPVWSYFRYEFVKDPAKCMVDNSYLIVGMILYMLTSSSEKTKSDWAVVLFLGPPVLLFTLHFISETIFFLMEHYLCFLASFGILFPILALTIKRGAADY